MGFMEITMKTNILSCLGLGSLLSTKMGAHVKNQPQVEMTSYNIIHKDTQNNLQTTTEKSTTCLAYVDAWVTRDYGTAPGIPLGATPTSVGASLRKQIQSDAVTTNTFPSYCEISSAAYIIDDSNSLVPYSTKMDLFIKDSNDKSKPHGMLIGGEGNSAQLKILINNKSEHQNLINQIIETADSTQATSIDIDLEWPESITECKNLLEFLINLKDQAGDHPIHFALHPFDSLGMYFNHEVEVNGKTFKTEIDNGNLKPVVFLYDYSNPNGNEAGLYRQTPQDCEYPKTNDGNGAYIPWDPNGDGSENYDPSIRPFRAQTNVDTVLGYLERNIPNFKNHAIISLPFFARANDPNDKEKKVEYPIASNGFEGAVDECGETTIATPLNTYGAKAFPFSGMLTWVRDVTANGFKGDLTVWQANLDTSDHRYLIELMDVFTLGKSLHSIFNSTETGYVTLPLVFDDGSQLQVSKFRNAKEIDANGADIDNTFVNGQNMTQSEFQTELELIIKKKRDPQSIGSNSSNGNKNNSLDWWAFLLIAVGAATVFYVLMQSNSSVATTNNEHIEIPNLGDLSSDADSNPDGTDSTGVDVLKSKSDLESHNSQVVESDKNEIRSTDDDHVFRLESQPGSPNSKLVEPDEDDTRSTDGKDNLNSNYKSDNRQVAEPVERALHRTAVNYIKLASDSDQDGNQVVENDQGDIESGSNFSA